MKQKLTKPFIIMMALVIIVLGTTVMPCHLDDGSIPPFVIRYPGYNPSY